MDEDTSFVEGVFDGFLSVEDVADFLKGAAPCFDEEEVDEDKFEDVPEDEEEVVLFVVRQYNSMNVIFLVGGGGGDEKGKGKKGTEEKKKKKKKKKTYLPTRARKRNPRHKRIIEIRNIDPKVVKCHALRSRLIPQTLYGVQLLQRRVTHTIHEPTDEDKRDNRFSLTGSLNFRRPIIA